MTRTWNPTPTKKLTPAKPKKLKRPPTGLALIDVPQTEIDLIVRALRSAWMRIAYDIVANLGGNAVSREVAFDCAADYLPAPASGPLKSAIESFCRLSMADQEIIGKKALPFPRYGA